MKKELVSQMYKQTIKDRGYLAFMMEIIPQNAHKPICDIFVELIRSIEKHPNDDRTDAVESASIMLCEAAEAYKESRKFEEGDDACLMRMRTECVQTAAMCLRMLVDLDKFRRKGKETNDNYE